METRRRIPSTWAIPIRAAAKVAAAALLAWGCCDGLSLRLSRMADFLFGVIELSAEVSASGLASVTFSGDFAGFADIPAFPADEVDLDLTGAAYVGGSAKRDVDYDAAKEKVTLLVAQGGALAAPAVFAKWHGDRYTADKGVCYLGWVDGPLVRLAATWCGDESGLMYCEMPSNETGAPSCELCDAETGSCAACDMGDREKACLPPKSVSGGIDIDIDIDFDHDQDVALDTDPDGAP
jgi:hypothetical protein